MAARDLQTAVLLGARHSSDATASATRLLEELIERGVADPEQTTGLLIQASHDGLSLISTEPTGPRRLLLDFTGPAAQRRLRTTRTDPLARAIGMRRGPAPKVLDGTCGMGRDTLALLGLGCEVTALERHPVVAALLSDALTRAEESPLWLPLRGRLTLLREDTTAYLKQLLPEQSPDVILLDPMYPGGRRRALPGGDTQLLQRLVPPGEDQEGASLLAAARSIAGKRVVIKRPRKAPPLGSLTPRSSHGTKATRYDVYGPAQPS